jgi:hypothetical protein
MSTGGWARLPREYYEEDGDDGYADDHYEPD